MNWELNARASQLAESFLASVPTLRIAVHDVAGGGRVTDFSGYTAAFPARQIQLGLKLHF